MPARPRSLPTGIPNARSTSSAAMIREPKAEADATTKAGATAVAKCPIPSERSVGAALELESRSAANKTAKLAACPFRLTPRSASPLGLNGAEETDPSHRIENAGLDEVHVVVGDCGRSP